MLPRCFEDEGDFVSEGSGAEEEDHAIDMSNLYVEK